MGIRAAWAAFGVRKNERGATAVLAAVLAMVLVGLSAFTLDFGRAYVSKRMLQNGADAGSLAAASYYADKPGTCPILRANNAYVAAAKASAAGLVQESRPGAVIDSFTVDCNSSGELTVDISVVGTTPVALGAVYGSKTITTQRAAQATLEVVEQAQGLRPYMICSTYAPEPSSLPTTVTRVDFPSASDSTGTCPHDSGNWFTVDCPHQGNGQNGNPDLAGNTRDGCDHTVSIVAGQDDTSATTLHDTLVAACPPSATSMADYDPDCLTSNPGNLGGSQLLDAWRSLISKTILLPVFCEKGTVPGKCAPAGWIAGGGNGSGNGSGGGNGTMYPVYKFASVKVCGYHWGNGPQSNSGIYSSSGPTDKCAGADARAGGNENYLLLAFVMYQYAGSTDDSTCAYDESCDGGGRKTRLTQ